MRKKLPFHSFEGLVWFMCIFVVILMFYIISELHDQHAMFTRLSGYKQYMSQKGDGAYTIRKLRQNVRKMTQKQIQMRQHKGNLSHYLNYKSSYVSPLITTGINESVEMNDTPIYGMEEIDGYTEYNDQDQKKKWKYGIENDNIDIEHIGYKLINYDAKPEQRVYIESPGRLGNQLFQYASGFSLAMSQNHTPVLPEFTAMSLRQLLDLSPSTEVHNMVDTVPVIEEKGAGIYNPELRRLPHRDVRICCYLQSWRYFDRTIINHIIKIKPQLIEKATQILHDQRNNMVTIYAKRYKIDLSKEELVYIGIHVRRTDFLSNVAMNQGYRSAPLKYILKALHYYEKRYENVIFIACSDDKQWLHDNLSWKANIRITTSGSDVLDLAVLTQCNHTITTTGTFSWWAGYLTGGEVTYYKDWLTPNSEIGRLYNKNDYFPKYWKAIDG